MAYTSRRCANLLCGVAQADYLLDQDGHCPACAREARAGTLVTVDPRHPAGPLFPTYQAATTAPITDCRCRWCDRPVGSGLLVFADVGVYHAHELCQLRCAGLERCPSCAGPMEADARLPWCRACDGEPEAWAAERAREEERARVRHGRYGVLPSREAVDEAVAARTGAA